MENKKWYVNQKVWDKTVSDEDGEIVEIKNENFILTLHVKFKCGIRVYSMDGIRSFNTVKTLSTTPYKIIMEGFSQEVEEELPKKGQVCWGIDSLGIWYVGHFVEKDEQGLYWISNSNNHTPPFSFVEIATKNPYAIEKEDREPKVGDMVFAWDDDSPLYVLCGKLVSIAYDENYPFEIYKLDNYKHCSLKNPLIK